jgi:hypothetical protein
MACMGTVRYGGFRSSLALAWPQVSRSKPALIPIGRSFPHPHSSLSASISSFFLLLLLHPLHDSALAIAGPRSSPHLTFSFIASTDSAIPFGSITLLRLYSLHSVTSTHAPSTEPPFSNLESADLDFNTLLFPARYSEAFNSHLYQRLIHPILSLSIFCRLPHTQPRPSLIHNID